jgi:hypothetical protein
MHISGVSEISAVFGEVIPNVRVRKARRDEKCIYISVHGH